MAIADRTTTAIINGTAIKLADGTIKTINGNMTKIVNGTIKAINGNTAAKKISK